MAPLHQQVLVGLFGAPCRLGKSSTRLRCASDNGCPHPHRDVPAGASDPLSSI